MIGKTFRGLGIDNTNDVLLGHIMSVVIVDDLTKISSLIGGLLLIVYTGLGIWEKIKKLTKDEDTDTENTD